MKKKILITGGAGYIGSKLATKLIKIGYEVTVIDALKFSSKSLNHLFSEKNFHFIKGDVRNKVLIKKLIGENEFIIPLAALVGAPLCKKNKSEAISVNLNSIKYLTKVASKKRKKIIYLTTNSGYGVGKKDKFCDENSPLKPISLYGRTKVEAEKIVMSYKNSVAFRLATVFGYSYRMRTDLLVNNFVFRSLNEKKLTIFEPHFRRNYIHVDDVVAALVSLLSSNAPSGVFNIGSGRPTSVAEIANIAADYYKKTRLFADISNGSGFWASTEKITSATDWRPRIGIDKGIASTLDALDGR